MAHDSVLDPFWLLTSVVRGPLQSDGSLMFIYTYDILNNAEAINVEVMMRMLKILWKETERKRVVEN